MRSTRSNNLFVVYILTILFLIATHQAIGDDNLSSLSPQELEYLKHHNIKSLNYSRPPDTSKDENGKAVGLYPDYAKEIENILGIKLQEKYFDNWHDLMQYARTGKDFMILGIANTDERSKYLLFTDGLLTVPFVVLSKQNSEIHSMPDLVGLKVCTVQGYAVNDYIHDYYPDIKLTDVIDNLEGFRGVSTGLYDAMIINQTHASYLIKEQGIVNLKIACESGYLNHLKAAVSKKEPMLYNILEKAIGQIPPEKKKEIYNKWYNLGKPLLSDTAIFVIIIVSSATAIIAGILWLWNISLKKQVARQTEKIEKSREEFEEIVAKSPIPMAISHSSYDITLLNDKFTEIFGYTIDDVKTIDQWCTVAYPEPAYRQQVRAVFDRVITRGERGDKGEPVQILDVRAKDGSMHTVELYITPLGQTAVTTLNDITERIKIEKERLKVEKLKSLSAVAGGLAHDFNNLLTAVFGNISIIQRNLADEQKTRKHLDMANKALVNAINLTSQLLTFTKGGEPILEPILIGTLLYDTVQFNLSSTKTKAIFSIPEKLWPAIADRGLLCQVISNLTVNASQAMPDGGILHVRASNFETNSVQYVKVSFQDTGKGIPKDLLDKVFDLYFTTKKVGSGLGLAICNSIIEKHNGKLEVESTGPEGTTFTILLPAGCNLKIEQELNEKNMRKPLEKALKVLLMDDEEMIRDLGVEMLELFGHKAETAVNGEEAIEKFKDAFENNNGYDIVVMDLTIPNGMGGLEAVKEILAISSEAKVIVSSGYSDVPAMAKYKEFGFSGRLAKPFDIDQFEEEIIRVANL